MKGAPETFDAAGFLALVSDLRRGDNDLVGPVFVRSEDGVRSDGVRVPREQQVVIVEGNYLLLDEPPWSRLVEFFDGICYLEVPVDELTRRLVARHVRHGRTAEDAAEFVHRSDLANARRIAAGRARATVIVEG